MNGGLSPSALLAAEAVRLGLTVSELRGDKQLRASVTEKAGLQQLARVHEWRAALEVLSQESERAARTHSGHGRCRACGEPVRWVTTVAGKNMPLNPLPSPGGNVLLRTATGGKGIVAQVVPNASLPIHGAVAYRSHYASCPFADQFRRRRESKPRGPVECPECGFRMDPWLAEHGYSAHVTCEEPP